MPKEVRDIKEVRAAVFSSKSSDHADDGSSSSSRLRGGTTPRVSSLRYDHCRGGIADGRHSVALRIKKSKKSQQTKFKIRAKRFVYTLVLKDAARADKLTQSMPPSVYTSGIGRIPRFRANAESTGLQKTFIGKKNKKDKASS